MWNGFHGLDAAPDNPAPPRQIPRPAKTSLGWTPFHQAIAIGSLTAIIRNTAQCGAPLEVGAGPPGAPQPAGRPPSPIHPSHHPTQTGPLDSNSVTPLLQKQRKPASTPSIIPLHPYPASFPQHRRHNPASNSSFPAANNPPRPLPSYEFPTAYTPNGNHHNNPAVTTTLVPVRHLRSPSPTDPTWKRASAHIIDGTHTHTHTPNLINPTDNSNHEPPPESQD